MSQAIPARPPAAPSLPLAIALAVAPAAGVLQSKALAPIAVAALLGCVLLHRQRHGTWPWPRGVLAWLAIGLFGWAAVDGALGAGAAAGAGHLGANGWLRRAGRGRGPGGGGG